MKLVAMQPTYLSYIGYYDLIDNSDVFVFYDDVQFCKQSWQQRNRIKTNKGVEWLTVPIIHDNKQLIKDVKIDNKQNWKKKHLKTIEYNYQKAEYFNDFFPYIKDILEHEYNYISELNRVLICKICDLIDITTKFQLSSIIKPKGTRVERLINLCKMFDCDTYLSTIGAKVYLKQGLFEQNNIRLEFNDYYVPPVYNQLYDGFVENLSIIDLLFNMGNKTLDIIRSCKDGSQ